MAVITGWIRGLREKYHYRQALRGVSRHKSLAEQEIETTGRLAAQRAREKNESCVDIDDFDDDIDWGDDDGEK